MYIIYNLYNLFISLVWRFKKSSSTDRRMYVTTLLLFVICYDCARKGLPRRG